jgi:cell division protein FtsI (penicillin-binding protein 3)
MKRPNPYRHAILQLFFLLILSIIIVRLAYLQLYRHDFFIEKSRIQLKRIIKLYPNRGTILDKEKRPLAMTQKSYSLFAVPPDIENKAAFSAIVAPYIGVTKKELQTKLNKTKGSFIWIERQVDELKALELKEKNIKGLGFIPTEKRVYPHGSLFAHVLGFVGIDNQGLAGLEYRFDSLLKGSPGEIILERDPRGFQLISGTRKTIPQHDGGHLVTTLDEFIQFSAQKHLKKYVDYNEAVKGQVLVMNPKTGAILAMASYPEFDPNEWDTVSVSGRKNTSVVDVFEPGSIFKVITIAAALEEQVVTPGEVLTVPEVLAVYDRVISEAHERDEDESDQQSVTEILQKSLNVGTAMIAMKIGEDKFYRYLKYFGFGSRTNIQLPGESRGMLRPLKEWSKVDIAMMAFGQGIAVTSIQMAAAVSAIANKGIYMNPRVVDYTTDYHFNTRLATPITSKKRVVRESTAEAIVDMMRGVVSPTGTAPYVAIPGYDIAGKTGTAQKAREDGRGYEKGKYVASFVGFFPASDAEILILVSVDSPKKSIWGSTVAGPIFKGIAEDIIDYRNMHPE